MEGWKIDNEGFLTKEFETENFLYAVEFITKIAPLAESIGHHPDIKLHSYKKINIFLKTHSENKITDKDYKLAEEIGNLVN